MKSALKFGYLKFFIKSGRKNTIIYLILKSMAALSFGVETVLIAYILDHMISNISEIKMIVCDFFMLPALWILKRLIEYLAQRKWIQLRKKVYTELPAHIVQIKCSLSYPTLENKDTQELIKRIGNEPEVQFCG